MSKTYYYCGKCESTHQSDSKIGKRHLEHKSLPFQIKKAADMPEICPDCNGTGVVSEGKGGLVERPCDCGRESQQERLGIVESRYVHEELEAESQPSRDERMRCTICQDTGLETIGHRPDRKGNSVPLQRYCKCGQETYDERIGLTPRRKGLGEPWVISVSGIAEALSRRFSGATHEQYLATVGDRPVEGSDSEPDAGQHRESEEQTTGEGGREDDEVVLPTVGDGVSDEAGGGALLTIRAPGVAEGVVVTRRSAVMLSVTPTFIREHGRQQLIDHVIAETAGNEAIEGTPFLTLSMEGCEGAMTFATADDIPLEDVPCPCGDETHFLLKYEEREA